MAEASESLEDLVAEVKAELVSEQVDFEASAEEVVVTATENAEA